LLPLGSKRHTLLFFVFFTALVLLLLAFNLFLQRTITCKCITHSDPLHSFFTARDFSSFIFLLTYLPLAIFIVLNIKNIRTLNLFTLGYCLIVFTRIICIYFLPLCEPAGAIPLNDYLLNNLFYPNGYCPLDLFYSGHTATLFLLALIAKKTWKYFLFVLTCMLGTLVIWQKVHYTIDVLAAIPITWICFVLAKQIYFLTSREKYIAR
jgi:hypothetical protein